MGMWWRAWLHHAHASETPKEKERKRSDFAFFAVLFAGRTAPVSTQPMRDRGRISSNGIARSAFMNDKPGPAVVGYQSTCRTAPPPIIRSASFFFLFLVVWIHEHGAPDRRTMVEHTQQSRRAINSTNAKQADKEWATEISTLANVHTAANVPVLVRSRKSSAAGLGQYCDG